MLQMQDLGAFRDIPGYTAITRAVLKSLIQGLVEQLSEHTGEESVILTASVTDGTLCHLGSGSGKDFLEGREEIKSQFLKHCLKKHHYRSAPTPEPPDLPIPLKPTFECVAASAESPGMAIKEKSPKPVFHPYSRPKKGRATQPSYDIPQSTNTSVTNSGDYQSETSTSAQSMDGFTSFGLADGSIVKIQATPASNLAQETGSSFNDQEDNIEDDATETQSGSSVMIKTEPDSDVTITGMMPGSQAEYSENWAASYATQGTSEYSDETTQPSYDIVRVEVVGQDLDSNDQSTTFVFETVNQNPSDELERGTSHEPPQTELYLCDLCGLGYTEKSELERHKIMHIKAKGKPISFTGPKSCDLSISILESCQSTDSQTKIFQCDICGNCFSRPDSVRRHKLGHLGHRFFCLYCPKSFSQESRRNYHSRNVCKKRP